MRHCTTLGDSCHVGVLALHGRGTARRGPRIERRANLSLPYGCTTSRRFRTSGRFENVWWSRTPWAERSRTACRAGSGGATRHGHGTHGQQPGEGALGRSVGPPAPSGEQYGDDDQGDGCGWERQPHHGGCPDERQGGQSRDEGHDPEVLVSVAPVRKPAHRRQGSQSDQQHDYGHQRRVGRSPICGEWRCLSV